MNDVLKVIKERRSVRRFTSEQLSNKALNAILEAGLYAPSAHNQQPWHFTVVQSKELIDALSRDTKIALGKSKDERTRSLSTKEKFHVFYEAPTLIVVSGKEDALMPTTDCAAAAQNMLLAAESIGIGGCWNGFVGALFYDEAGEAYKESLNIPEGYQPYYALTFGHSDSGQQTPSPRKENRISYIK